MFLLPAGMVIAQTGAPDAAPRVHATLDKTRILIGEPIQLMLEATVPGNAPLVWPILDSLPHFEFIEKGKVDSAIHPDGRYYRQYLTVTSFDSGFHAIPRLPFVAGLKRSFTDSVRIEVDYSKFDPKQDYHDIRDIIDIPNPYVHWIGWVVGFITLSSLALVIWLVAKRYRSPNMSEPVVVEPRLSPYEEALKQLEELAGQAAWENGPVKAYYTRLNDILRLFLLRRFGIASLVETNDELIGQVRSLHLGNESFSRLTETLRMSDFVKFAKYQPAVSDNEHNFRVIHSSIAELEKIANEQDAEKARSLAAADAIANDNITKNNSNTR
jgi:hypothetical protein